MQEALIFNLQKFSIHDGAGIRTDVFFQGCNLRCGWCSNPESQPMEPLPGEKVTRYTVDALVRELVKDKPFYDESGGGVTLTGGEPTLQLEAVLAFLQGLKTMGVNTCMEQNGTCVRLPALLPWLDWLIMDVKHYDGAKLKAVTGAGGERLRRNLRAVLDGPSGVALRIPLIGGFNASKEDAEGFVQLFDQLHVGQKATLELLPYHEYGKQKYKALGLPYTMTEAARVSPQTLAEMTAVFESAGYRLVRT